MKKREKKKAALPAIIYSELSPISPVGVSLFDMDEQITVESVEDFISEKSLVHKAMKKLRELGFEVLYTNYITINVAGAPKLYEEVFKTSLKTVEKPTIKHLGIKSTTTVIDTTNTPIEGLIDTSESILADMLEGGAINRKVYFFGSESYIPPAKTYWNLHPPEMATALNAELVHRTGITGRNVKVVMVDTGWYNHPYFIRRGYKVNPTIIGPSASDPQHDEVGHGTGESTNIFAIAPDIEFTMVKMGSTNMTGSFNVAVSLQPDIISCSWGVDLRNEQTNEQLGPPLPAGLRPLEAAIANAVRQGIVVIFSAGNGHYGFPGMYPEVISGGGTYMDKDGITIQATQYASGFGSKIYPGRNVPDVCGLVGLPPKAIYLMLPVEPGDEIDNELSSGGSYPSSDETTKNDGWAAFSGTSAAAPQIAGVCALIKQVCPRLSPPQIKGILASTAIDVIKGKCSPATGSNSAKPGPDLATGAGMVDAFNAVRKARDIC